MDLWIEFQGGGFSFGRLTFRTIEEFRVLPERDLLAFWEDYHEGNGWLWEVETGGWRDLERLRPDYTAQWHLPNLREYLVVDHTCISVFAHGPPTIDDLGSDPTEHLALKTSERSR